MSEQKARFTLTIENDDFDKLDLVKFSQIMGGATQIAGPKARLVKHTMTEMVFEEESPRAWREVQDRAGSDSIDDPLKDEIEYMDDAEIRGDIVYHLGHVNMEMCMFEHWSRESLLAFRELVLKEKQKA